MIVSYEEYKLNENDYLNDYSGIILETVVQNLYEYGELSESNMEELFGFINENIESYNVDIPALLSNYSHIIDESYDSNADEYVYSLTNRGIQLYELDWNLGREKTSTDKKTGDETTTKWGLGSKKARTGWAGALDSLGGMHKQHVKGQATQAKLAAKKNKQLQRHDYRMAKLSAKSKDNAFDSYSKLASTSNNRYQ